MSRSMCGVMSTAAVAGCMSLGVLGACSESSDTPFPDATASPTAVPSMGDHPRIWWTAERLALGHTWLQSEAGAAVMADALDESQPDPLMLAMDGLLGNRPEHCRQAAERALSYSIPEDELTGTCDACRWYPWPYLVFDWCYASFSALERQTLIERFNTELKAVHDYSLLPDVLGGEDEPANNYFWGYLRNELNWGIATLGENAQAESFIQGALEQRWDAWAAPFFEDGDGAGGVGIEGSEYGVYMQENAILPLDAARYVGRQVFQESHYFREALLYWIYTTTPARTGCPNSGAFYYQFFPFADDEGQYDPCMGFPSAQHDPAIGSVMTFLAGELSAEKVGEWGRAWLGQVQPVTDPYVLATADGGVARPISELPLDYYAPGPGFFFTRNRWAEDAAVLLFQLKRTQGNGGHDHNDFGSFQIWQKGVWVAKESTLYAAWMDWGSAFSSWAHNTLTLSQDGAWEGRPYGAVEGYPAGDPQVTRLESAEGYAYAAVDLTPAYLWGDGWWYTEEQNGVECFREVNPYVVSAVREFLYLRGLNALIVLDRVESKDSTEDEPTQEVFGDTYFWRAEEVNRIFNLHLNAPEPTLDEAAHIALIKAGKNQQLRLLTLLPEQVSYAVRDEQANLAGAEGYSEAQEWRQWRLEVRGQGERAMHMLNVLQLMEEGGRPLEAQLVSNTESSVRVRLTLGEQQAEVTFDKGMTSTGGTVATGTGSLGAARALRADVQTLQVDGDGVHWE